MGSWPSAATVRAGLAAQINVQSSHEGVGSSGHARHCACAALPNSSQRTSRTPQDGRRPGGHERGHHRIRAGRAFRPCVGTPFEPHVDALHVRLCAGRGGRPGLAVGDPADAVGVGPGIRRRPSGDLRPRLWALAPTSSPPGGHAYRTCRAAGDGSLRTTHPSSLRGSREPWSPPCGPPWRSTPREPRGPLSHDADAGPGAPAPGPFHCERSSCQQELPQDDELLPQDDELPQDEELPQDDEPLPEQEEEEPPQEEPDGEPSQESPAAYQDEPLDAVPTPPVADAAPVPLLVGHAPYPCPLRRPYPGVCGPRWSQARRQARRTSQAHSTAITSTATTTTTKAVTIIFSPPPSTGPGAPAVRTLPPAVTTSISP